MTGTITIGNETLEADVNEFGAELVALRLRGRNLLWYGDPDIWAGRAPILFPIVGRVRDDRIVVEGKDYPMGQHGFARQTVFGVESQSRAQCQLSIQDNDESRKHYPFSFALTLDYAIVGQRLSMTASVNNPGEDSLPASFGFHPGFLWPLEEGKSKTDYCLRFDADHELERAHPGSDGLVAPDIETITLNNGVLDLDEGLFAKGAMIMRAHKSREVTFAPRRGGLGLKTRFENLPYLGIWMRPGGNYLCIEPWHGHADPWDFHGSFAEKPGLAQIGPNETKTFRMIVEIIET